MKRYYFVQPWEKLQDGAHQSVVEFSIQRAQKLGIGLVICVHNLSSCEQFLKKCFPGTQAKKLLRREEISRNGIKVKLESLQTIKANYHFPDAKVYLALFPSSDLMARIEAITSKKAIVVFSETLNSEHLVEWCKEHNAKELTLQ
ncbi:hypothetical protein [Cellvibrio sp. PSBB006]|uniref:hypothetical protein n=1 Tax=Cellvibrio sp. PSBB006 TaxID=1987723 RepID=UPI000B3B8FD4|nr:hypothetical protein [Cellvibrio sp. PSBB006]ARU26070.1 hypothetical protein CBR65_00710 [Cellvibrio sp. PSBB006]